MLVTVQKTPLWHSGLLNSINAALKRLTYRGDSDSNFEQAFEALTLHITDTGIDGMKSSHHSTTLL